MRKLVQNFIHEIAMLFKFVALLLIASCSNMDDQLSDFAERNDLVQLEEYNYKTDEKASFKLISFPGYKLRVSDEKFYLKKTFKLTGDDVKLSQAINRDEGGKEHQATANFINTRETMLGWPSSSQ
jgi:hypothetical protein